jgi:transcriptional repressor NF-X1
MSSGGADLSCSEVCDRQLGCGNHTCQQVCHAGDCEPCSVREMARCYCGRVEREVPCGEGEVKECALGAYGGQDEQKWLGRFCCENVCNR